MIFVRIFSFPHLSWYLVLIGQQFGELWYGASGQLSVILIVDEMDDGCFEEMRGLGQSLHIGGLVWIALRGEHRLSLHQRLGEHGRTYSLSSS